MRFKSTQRSLNKSYFESERLTNALRSSRLQKHHLILPLFVSERPTVDTASMPTVPVCSAENIVTYLEEVLLRGISSVILFGIPKKSDSNGSAAFAHDGIVQRCLRLVKSSYGRRLNLISDVCLCQYNVSGHCGILNADGSIDNDKSLQTLSKIAASHAEAGADIVAPSAMMDGQVAMLRSSLDRNGFPNTRILSFSAKHASALYTPFRSAAYFRNGKKGLIDKSSYQVSFANPRQAMREIAQDIAEGADMVMIKPALWYLDLVAEAKERYQIPVIVQSVSGEHSMIMAAAEEGLIDEQEWKVLALASMKRAGADGIISYFALDIAPLLEK